MNKSNLRALLTPIVLALAIVFGMMLNRFLPDRTQVSASSEMFLPVTGSKLDLIIKYDTKFVRGYRGHEADRGEYNSGLIEGSGPTHGIYSREGYATGK